jgi:type IV pilus assembly protein PilC
LDLGSLLRGKREVYPGPAFRPIRLLKRLVFRRRRFLALRVTEQVARIVACNAPLVSALDAAMEQPPNYGTWRALKRLRDPLAAGASLSEAMRRQPRLFPRYYTDLVQAGERTGTLEQSLTELANMMEDSMELRGAVLRPVYYFILLVAITSLISSFIMVKIIPVLAEVAHDFGSSPSECMPVLLQVMERIASWFGRVAHHGGFHWVPWYQHLILVGIVVLACIVALRRGYVRLGPTWLALRIPWLRQFPIKANLAHAARVLRRLLAAGYPVDEAIEATATADIRPEFSSALLRLRERVQQGESLSQAVEREARWLPPGFRGMVSVGESAGDLPEALDRIAVLYRRDVADASVMATRLLLPLVVFTVGAFVYAIYSYPFRLLVVLYSGLSL